VLTTVVDNRVTFETFDQIGAGEDFKLVESWSVQVGPAPAVGLVVPAEGSTFAEFSAITLSAQASESGETITKVEFLVDGVAIGEDPDSPYSFIWNNVAAGRYVLSARATNSAGISSGSAPVAITVLANTAPIVAPIPDQTVNAASLLSFTASATDPQGNGLSFSLSGAPAGAAIDARNGVFSWTPLPAQAPGNYTFDIVVTDDGVPAASASTSVNVTVNAVNHAPVADDLTVSTLANAAVTITLTAFDADADPLSYSIVDKPANGLLTGAGNNLIYTPNAGYAGSDSFTFQCNDGMADSNTATVSITILADPDPGPDPIFSDQFESAATGRR
jgi:hypothetical protein